MPEVVLITGAAKRIGRSLALDFAQNNFDVCIHYHQSKKEAQTLAEEIHQLGKRAYLIPGNLSQEKEVEEIFLKVREYTPQVSVLINNASTFEYDHIDSVTRNSWDRHIEPNLRAPFILSQAFSRQTSSGLILNMIDQRVWNLTPHYMTYTLSKLGLWGLTQTMALALAPSIRVNAIGPGPILKNAQQSEEEFDQQCQKTLLKKGGSLREICAAARFFVDSPSVTGQMIAIDGGQHLGWATPPLLPEWQE